jgi:hypothetical protein
MFVDTYTTIHSIISLLALALGFIVILDFFGVRIPPAVTALFLLLAFLTSATGFGFPFNGVLPSHVVGVLALIFLAITVFARYAQHLRGIWRPVYVIGIAANAFFLVFVGVAQAFAKIPSLQVLAPTQSEPPFAITQLIVLAIFVVIAIVGLRGYRPEMISPLGRREMMR